MQKLMKCSYVWILAVTMVLSGYMGMSVAQGLGVCDAYYSNGTLYNHVTYGCCWNQDGSYPPIALECPSNCKNCSIEYDLTNKTRAANCTQCN
jgi:hypothetical protein